MLLFIPCKWRSNLADSFSGVNLIIWTILAGSLIAFLRWCDSDFILRWLTKSSYLPASFFDLLSFLSSSKLEPLILGLRRGGLSTFSSVLKISIWLSGLFVTPWKLWPEPSGDRVGKSGSEPCVIVCTADTIWLTRFLGSGGLYGLWKTLCVTGPLTFALLVSLSVLLSKGTMLFFRNSCCLYRYDFSYDVAFFRVLYLTVGVFVEPFGVLSSLIEGDFTCGSRG